MRGVFAYDPGAQVLVSEAHAGFRNLLPDQLDRRAELLRGKPKPDGMLSGLSDSVDAAVFIGYHGKAGTARSVLAHTIHGGVVADVRCDGRSFGELGLNAALAATAGVPAVLVAGDDSVAAEAADIVPGMHAVVVKRALGGAAAASLHPDEACDRIELEVPKALADRDSIRGPAVRRPRAPGGRRPGTADGRARLASARRGTRGPAHPELSVHRTFRPPTGSPRSSRCWAGSSRPAVSSRMRSR